MPTVFVAEGTDRARQAEETGKLKSESNIERVFRVAEDSFVVVVSDPDAYPLPNEQIEGAPPTYIPPPTRVRRINAAAGALAGAVIYAAAEVVRWLL